MHIITNTSPLRCRQEKDPERTVFVAPLHNGEITETKLETHFGTFGAVSKVTIMYDKATGNSKGSLQLHSRLGLHTTKGGG